ncbi:uncharacterized protein [Paramisgurnus dabryanus]|uniref:uncharacterized protein isoform X2 n=1 Tax=Paramisgurnus dabryanus TaxID=90735 RepID=UPI003CCF95E9
MWLLPCVCLLRCCCLLGVTGELFAAGRTTTQCATYFHLLTYGGYTSKLWTWQRGRINKRKLCSTHVWICSYDRKVMYTVVNFVDDKEVFGEI